MTTYIDAIKLVKSALQTDSDLIALVPSANIFRGYQQSTLVVPSIEIICLDKPSTPKLGYLDSKKRYEDITLQFNIYIKDSDYIADQVVGIIEKILLNISTIKGPEITGYNEGFDSTVKVFTRNVRYSFVYEVQDN